MGRLIDSLAVAGKPKLLFHFLKKILLGMHLDFWVAMSSFARIESSSSEAPEWQNQSVRKVLDSKVISYCSAIGTETQN